MLGWCSSGAAVWLLCTRGSFVVLILYAGAAPSGCHGTGAGAGVGVGTAATIAVACTAWCSATGASTTAGACCCYWSCCVGR